MSSNLTFSANFSRFHSGKSKIRRATHKLTHKEKMIDLDADEPKISTGYLNDENIESLRFGYIDVKNDLRELLFELHNFGEKLISRDAQRFCAYGLLRRLSHSRHMLSRFSAVFEVEAAGNPISRDTRIDQTAFLNFYLVNLAGALDNFAWVLKHEYNIETRGVKDISLFSGPVYERLLPETKAVLVKPIAWKAYHKEFRDSAAHRLQPYVVPYLEMEDGSRTYCSVYATDDKSDKAFLHSQVQADANTIILFIDTVLKDARIWPKPKACEKNPNG